LQGRNSKLRRREITKAAQGDYCAARLT